MGWKSSSKLLGIARTEFLTNKIVIYTEFEPRKPLIFTNGALKGLFRSIGPKKAGFFWIALVNQNRFSAASNHFMHPTSGFIASVLSSHDYSACFLHGGWMSRLRSIIAYSLYQKGANFLKFCETTRKIAENFRNIRNISKNIILYLNKILWNFQHIR